MFVFRKRELMFRTKHGTYFFRISSEWKRVCEESVVEKYVAMKSASDDFGEFRSLVAQETVWLDRLEKKLEKSAQTTAADAEEISEELDDIENFLNRTGQNGERHVRLKVLPGFIFVAHLAKLWFLAVLGLPLWFCFFLF